MKKTLPLLTTGALALAATTATAQYAPPPPTQPVPGFLNQELRAADPDALTPRDALALLYQLRQKLDS